MKKLLPFLLLTAVLVFPNMASAGDLTAGCFPVVDCDEGQDFYGGQCNLELNSVDGTIPSCVSVKGAAPAGKAWAFSCDAGCYLNVGGGAVDTCPGGVMVNEECLIKLSVLDDSEDIFSVGNGAYKIWNANELSEVVHVPNVGCPNGTMPVSSTASSTGWVCSSTSTNVGIGTGPTSSRLTVSGNAQASGYVRADGGFYVDGRMMIRNDGYYHRAQSTDGTHYGFFEGRNSSNSRGFYLGWGNGTDRVDLNLDSASKLLITGGNVGIGVIPAYPLDVNGSANVDSLCINGGTCYTSWSSAVGDNSLWTLSGSDIYRNLGKVGIGTSTPLQRLDVGGNIKAHGLEMGSDNFISSNLRYDAGVFRYRSPGKATAIRNDSGWIAFLTAPSGSAGSIVNPSVRMHIANDGKIGIGTTMPTGALHVKTDIDADTGTNDASVIVGDSNAVHLEIDKNEILAKKNSRDPDALYLQKDGGKVGIGSSTAPAYTLDVAGQANVDAICINGGTCYTDWETVVEDNSLWIEDGSDVYRSGGYVGIGTDSPIGPLHIRTDVDAGPTESSASFVIGNPNASHTEFDSNEIMAKASATTTSTLYLQNNGGDLSVNNGTFYVDDSEDSVGIGTKTPGETLEVVGTIKATGFVCDDCVDASNIAFNSITASEIKNYSIGYDDLADNSVGSTTIIDGQVQSNDIKAGAIGTSHIADYAITSAKIEDGAVGDAQIKDGAVDNDKILDGSIRSADIRDYTITGTDIASGTITASNIKDGTITSNDIKDGTVHSYDIMNGTITGTDIASLTITGSNIASATISGTKIEDYSIGSIDIASDAITSSKMADNSVYSSNIVNSTITGSDIAWRTITSSDIASGTITGSEVKDGSLSGNDIANGSLISSDIADNAITSAKISDGTITSTDIADGTITGTDIAYGSVYGSDIASNTITSSDLSDSALLVSNSYNEGCSPSFLSCSDNYNLGNHDFCFLTKVSGDEYHSCEVVDYGTSWQLETIAIGSGSAVNCSARCIDF